MKTLREESSSRDTHESGTESGTSTTRLRIPSARVPLAFRRLPAPEMISRARVYAEAMDRRRTVREFSSEPFPLVILEHAIRAASSAPSGANQQPWTFVVVTDPDTKSRLRVAAEAEEKKNWEERMSSEWLDALEPLGIDWRKPHLTDAPALVVVFAQRWGEVATPDGGTRRVKHYYVDESVGIAVGLLLSAIHLAGLVALTHTPSPMTFLRTLLGRPANERAFVVIPVGYPADATTVPTLVRKPIDTVRVHR